MSNLLDKHAAVSDSEREMARKGWRDVGFAGGQLVYPIIMDFVFLFVLVCPFLSPLSLENRTTSLSSVSYGN